MHTTLHSDPVHGVLDVVPIRPRVRAAVAAWTRRSQRDAAPLKTPGVSADFAGAMGAKGRAAP